MRFRLDRMRWWLIKKLVGRTPPLELVGYAFARAGYTDHPHVTDDFLTMYATGSEAWHQPSTQEPEDPSAWAVYDGTACPTCGSSDPAWDYWPSDRLLHARNAKLNLVCPDAFHGPSTTQEAEKALETLETALNRIAWVKLPYGGVNTQRIATDALPALRSLRTQHTELRDEMQEWINATARARQDREAFREALDEQAERISALQLQHTKDQERIEELEAALREIANGYSGDWAVDSLAATAEAALNSTEAIHTPTHPKEGDE